MDNYWQYFLPKQKISLSFNRYVKNDKNSISEEDESGKKLVPDVVAVYCLFSTFQDNGTTRWGKLEYVGRSIEGLRTRLLKHITTEVESDRLPSKDKNGNFYWYAWAEIKEDQVKDAEAAMILQFKPPMNAKEEPLSQATEVTISGDKNCPPFSSKTFTVYPKSDS